VWRPDGRGHHSPIETGHVALTLTAAVLKKARSAKVLKHDENPAQSRWIAISSLDMTNNQGHP
jgi:hypothetical protein